MRDDGRIELGRLNLGWNDTRTERLLAHVKLRIGRRARVRRALLASTALTSVACIAAFALRPSPSSNAVSRAVSAVAPALIRLGDGSEIRVDPTASEVRVVEEQPWRVRVEAIRGRAHYSVVPNPGRSFEVASGSVTVRVVGTEFQVERREDKTFVEVSRGKVEVVWNGGAGREFISAGESGSFPRPAEPIAIDEGLRPHDDARAQSPSVAYRARVGSHDFRGAYAILSRHPALAGDTVKELLVAADVARLSEHPAEAVAYLQRIVREHPRDERAHQAAFTLGRTLSGLGRTKEAMTCSAACAATGPETRSPRTRSSGRPKPRARSATSPPRDASPANTIAIYPNGQRREEVRRHARLEDVRSPRARDATTLGFRVRPRSLVGRARPGRRRSRSRRFGWRTAGESRRACPQASSWRSTCFGASTGPTRAMPERIAVRCDDAGAEITVAMGGAARTSTVDLGGLAAEHRARALALAAAEMVHAMIGAPVPEAPQATTPAAPPPAVSLSTAPLATDSPAPPPRAQPTLLVGGVAQWLGRPAALLLGARAAFRYPLGDIFVPALSIEVHLGDSR